MVDLDPGLLDALRVLDTPTVCNALEVVAPERRGTGFTHQPLVCVRPGLPSVVGFARTATIRATDPPADLAAGYARDAYYDYIDEGPKPSVVVIQDLDPEPGYGSFWGEVNSNIHTGLGCLATITNGSVRDLPDLADGFQVLAGRVGPSHGFVRVVDFGVPVTVAGMSVGDGDLVHADQHGAVVVPIDSVAGVLAAADLIVRKERVILDAAQTPGFSAAKLRAAQARAADLT